MADYFMIAKLGKPDWLKQDLDDANVFILGNEYRIGDAIEKAVDWLLEVINLVAESVVGGLNVLWSRIDTLDTDLNTGINSAFSGISILGSRLDVLDGKLSRLFENNKELVEGWILAKTEALANMVVFLNKEIFRVKQDLADLKEPAKAPWWSPARIIEEITNMISPFKKNEEDRKNLFEWMWLFFQDPPKFLYEMADDLIDRFW